MSRPSARLAVAAVCLVMGFLGVVQFRTQAVAGGLAELSAADLTTLIANLDTRNQQLASEEAGLRRRLEQLRASGGEHDRLVASIREDLSRVRRWAGLEPVRGRGVRVVVDGPVGPLPCWWFHGPDDAGATWAVLVHGRSGSRVETFRYLGPLHRSGLPAGRSNGERGWVCCRSGSGIYRCRSFSTHT